jgi:hypothetical protein
VYLEVQGSEEDPKDFDLERELKLYSDYKEATPLPAFSERFVPPPIRNTREFLLAIRKLLVLKASRDDCNLLNPDNFTARNLDELSFRKGDLLELLEGDDNYGDGWYIGLNLMSGERGLFPQGM